MAVTSPCCREDIVAAAKTQMTIYVNEDDDRALLGKVA